MQITFKNDYFIQIGPNLASKIPTEETDQIEYVNKTTSQFAIMPVTPSQVKKSLQKVNVSKATGLDNISNRFLKMLRQ